MNKERVLKEFFELVQIDSPTRSERAMADVMKAKLKEMGADEIWEDDVGEKIGGNAGNVFGFFKGNKAGAPCVMLGAHIDCVVPCIGVKPVLKDGVIRSGGDTILSSDDKSGVVAVLEAVRVMKEENFPHGDVQVIFTVAEEGGLNGSKNMDKKHLRADFGYIFDASGHPGKVVIMAPGQYKIHSVFKGKTAHAGLAPEDGVNAIVLAGKALAEVKDGRIDEETTCNIGLIQAGAATNIVPDTCTVTSEARSRNPEKLEALVKDIKETFERVAAQNGGSATVTPIRAYNPFVLKEEDGLVKLAVRAAQNLGFPSSCESTGGGSDANFFNEMGVPSAVLATGMSKVHTTDEFILEQDLYDAAAWAVELIKEAAK
jgi:peptidase T-like protein